MRETASSTDCKKVREGKMTVGTKKRKQTFDALVSERSLSLECGFFILYKH
jgi:hypothetical protein